MVRRCCVTQKKVFCPLDKPYWATEIDRKFDSFPSFPPMANRSESAPDGQRHFPVPNNHDNQRRMDAHNLLLMQHQYGLSPNPNNIQPSSYFQNTHPNSRAAYGDARAARPNPSVARVRRGDAPPLLHVVQPALHFLSQRHRTRQ